jgi:hypothetical protein
VRGNIGILNLDQNLDRSILLARREREQGTFLQPEMVANPLER